MKKVVIAIAAVVCLAVPAFAAGEAQYFFQRGMQALSDDDLLAAVINLRTAYRFAPDNEDIRTQLAIMYNNYAFQGLQDDADKSLLMLSCARALAPESGDITNNLSSMYNAKGVELSRAGDPAAALPYYERALLLTPENSNVRENASAILAELGYQASTTRRFVEAKGYLDRALDLNHANVNALVIRGNIHYEEQEMEDALALWRQALALRPELGDLRQKIARVETENSVEAEFGDMTSFHFEIRFEGINRRFEVYDVLRELEEAYDVIGADFRRFPDHKIVALIYSENNYRELTGSPEWTGAIYDGKIRVPIANIQGDRERLRGILRHEYTHALVHELTANNCPIWFNEGLAQYEQFRGRGTPSLMNLQNAIANNTLLSMAQISGSFMRMTPENAKLAYEQSYVMTDYLIRRYGFQMINRILDKLKERMTMEDILNQDLQLNEERFTQAWRSHFAARYAR